jgi:transcriptional regulator with XRE-family HTH domain
MAIDLRSLGAKLAKYRGQLQESPAEVARSTGIAVARLAAIEGGHAEPTGDEVLILADHYRCDFKFFISNEQVAPFEQTETLYRAHGENFTKEDRRAVQDFLYLCETEDFLMRELGRPRENFAFSPTGDYFKGHGVAAAVQLRAALGHDDRTVPRDIYEEFRSVGLHVFRRKLGNSNISGLFVMHENARWSTTARTSIASASAQRMRWLTPSSTRRKARASASSVLVDQTCSSCAPTASHLASLCPPHF